MLDTVIEVETPEGMQLELRPAGLTARFYAFLIDWMIRLVAASVGITVAAFLGGLGTASFFVLAFALEWLYPVAFELTASGATPGKRAMGLAVVMDSGLPVTLAASISRNILRAADFVPVFYAAAVVSLLIRHDCKRLGDIAAGTLVVHTERIASAPPGTDIIPLAPVRPLTLADQAALIALAARVPRLTPERTDELAALAAVVSGDEGQSGSAVTLRVLGVAQWALGRRR